MNLRFGVDDKYNNVVFKPLSPATAELVEDVLKEGLQESEPTEQWVVRMAGEREDLRLCILGQVWRR
jgi:hypothetical protein